MNSVAGQMVATMMNTKFNAQQSTGSTRSKDHQNFSKIFKQVNDNKPPEFEKAQTKTEIEPVNDAESTKAADADAVVKSEAYQNKGEVVRDTVPGHEVSEVAKDAKELKGLSEKVHEIMAKLKDDVIHVDLTLGSDENKALYDEAMVLVSQIFGIPLEELQSVLQELNMDLLNLSDAGKLAEVVQTVFGNEGMAEMLLNGEATETFKAVHVEVEKLYEALNLDADALKEKVPAEEAVKPTVVHVKESSDSKAATLTPEKGTNLEIVNLRGELKAGKYTQDNQGQNQNNQTFGELMSQNMTGIKEIVVAANSEQTEFQQITTREVIDQIVTKAIVNLSTDKTSIQLQLNPEHLGKVAVSITAEQGFVKGQFVAENQMVKEMLEANMVQLKSQLEEQGIKVEKIEVTIGNSNQFFDQQDRGSQNQEASGKSGKRRVGHIGHVLQMDEVEVAEINAQREAVTALEEYTVEYSA